MRKTKAYSLDLRERVVKAVNLGMEKETVMEVFGISRSSVNRWCLLAKSNQLAPKEDWKKGHSHRIKDFDAFRKFVEANSTLTQTQMAEKWGNISKTSIGRYIRKVGYTKKKDLFYTKSVTKQSARNIERK